MKKHLALLLALSLVFFCAACGATGESVTGAVSSTLTQSVGQTETKNEAQEKTLDTVTDNRAAAQTAEEPAEEPAVTQPEAASDSSTPQLAPLDPSQFETREFVYETMFGDTKYFVAVKNNSTYTVGISANGVAYDAGGGMIGADDMTIDVIGPGQESIGYFYFSGVSGIASVGYDLQFDLDPHYTDVLAGLTHQMTLNPSNAIVSVTNNGTQAAQFVEANVLFFDAAGKVVYYNSTYVTDDDFELKPGATLTVQVDCYEAYDHAELFLTGRSDYIWSW